MTEVLEPMVIAGDRRFHPVFGQGRLPRFEILAGAFIASYSSAGTRRAYGADLKSWQHFCADVEIDPVLDVRRSFVDVWMRRQEEAEVSVSSIARRLSTLCMFFDWCIDEEYLNVANPARKVRRPKVPQESKTPFLRDRLLADFVDAAEQLGGYDYALACLLAFNALRIGEACGADVGDLGRDRHHHTLAIMGKGAKPDVVVLGPRTSYAVERALDGRTDGPLLLTQASTRLNREAAGRAVRRVCKAAGIDQPLSPHGLRHSAITAALEAGEDVDAVRRFARHENLKTTQRYDRRRLKLDASLSYSQEAHIAARSGR